MNPQLFILVNIGCIECGVSTNIVGVFDSAERAHELCALFDKKYGWREGGQNIFQVFPMPDLNVINSEYEA